jgi:hypothetical protein
LKEFSQPSLGFEIGRMMIWFFSTSSSTSSIIPVCSRIGFGMRMPWEFPIFITRTLMIYLFGPISAHIVITSLWNVKGFMLPDKSKSEQLKAKRMAHGA